MKEKENYTLKKVIESKECKIRVFSPTISDEERARRMKAIHKAAANLLCGKAVNV